MQFLTTTEAAAQLGISSQRVRVLIREGRLPAVRVGPVYLIEPKVLRAVRRLVEGRPPRLKITFK